MLPFGKVSSALLQAKAGKAGSQEQGDDPSELLWGWSTESVVGWPSMREVSPIQRKTRLGDAHL